MVAIVQFASSGSSSGSSSVSFGSPTTAANRVIACVSLDTGTSQPASVTLTGSSDTFTLDAHAANANPTANVNLGVWSDANCSGGHTTVVSSGTSLSTLQAVFEASGTNTGAGATASSGGAAPASTLQASFDSGAAGSVAAGCLWIGAVTGIGSGGRAQASPSGSWTTEAALQPGGASQMLPAYQAGPGAGAPEYAGMFTGPVAGAYWAAAVAAYAPPGGAVSGAAALAGTGTLTAGGRKSAPGAAALTGAGAFTASGRKTAPGAAALAGSGTLAAAGAVSVPGAAALTGTGALAAAGYKHVPAAAAMTGAGALTAAGIAGALGSAALTGLGTLTAAGDVTRAAAAAMSGAGTLTATGTGTAPATSVLFSVTAARQPWSLGPARNT